MKTLSPRPRKKRKAGGDEEITVLLEGIKVTVTTTKRPLLVELTKSSVNAILAYCRAYMRGERASAGTEESPKSHPPKAKFQMPKQDCPAIEGKVTWQPSHDSWAAHFKDSEKKRCIARFKAEICHENPCALIPIPDICSTPRERAQAARKEAYIKAIRHWNEFDKSTRDRIIEPAP